MEIKYDKETDSKYVQIKKGVVAGTKEHADWFFLDCAKNGDVLGVEILDASKHDVNLITVNNTLIGFSLEETAPSVETFRKNALSARLVHEPLPSTIEQVQLVS